MAVSMSYPFRSIALLIVLTASAWADIQAGMVAYERGDFSTALKKWLPVAEQGGEPNLDLRIGAAYAHEAQSEATRRSREMVRRLLDRAFRTPSLNSDASTSTAPQASSATTRSARLALTGRRAESTPQPGSALRNVYDWQRSAQDYSEAVSWCKNWLTRDTQTRRRR